MQFPLVVSELTNVFINIAMYQSSLWMQYIIKNETGLFLAIHFHQMLFVKNGIVLSSDIEMAICQVESK